MGDNSTLMFRLATSPDLPQTVPCSCPSYQLLASAKKNICLSSIFASPAFLRPTRSIQKTESKHRTSYRTVLHALLPTAQCCSTQDDSLPGFHVRKPRKIQTTESSGGATPKQDDFLTIEINKWLNDETGGQRLRNAYAIGNLPLIGMFKQDDTQKVNNVVFYCTLLGLTWTFLAVAVEQTALQPGMTKKKNLSATQALLKDMYVDKKVPKQILTDTARSGALLLARCIALFHIPHMVAVYRNETTFLDFFVPTVVTYGLNEFKKCPVHLLKQFGKGAVAGAIYGVCMTSYLSSAGLTQEERHLGRITETLLNKRYSQIMEEKEKYEREKAERAASLPEGWEELIDSRTGRIYFQNNISRKTQWEMPSSSS